MWAIRSVGHSRSGLGLGGGAFMPQNAGVGWKLEVEATRSRIIARFDGFLSDDEGGESARRFVQALGTRKWHVVFDVRGMDGYASAARRSWQQVLAPKRHQVISLTVVGGGPIVRMGAAALGLALGVPTQNVDAMD